MTIGATLRANLAPTTGTVIVATTPTGLFDIIRLDTTLRRSHSDEVDVVTFPVESTVSYATDNVRTLPPTLTVSGVLTDTPVLPLAGALYSSPGRATDALDKLLELMNRGEPLLVTTDIRVHPERILRSIAVDEDPSTGDAIFVTLGFTKAQILYTTTIPVQLFDVDAMLAGAAGTVEKGVQSLIDKAKEAASFLGF